MSLSVIIPVKNRPEPLARAVDSLLGQTTPPEEIIVVDQSEHDGCRRAVEAVFLRRPAEKRPVLLYVHDPSIEGLTAARNVGLARSLGSIVVYCDDDAELEQNGIASLRQVFARQSRSGGRLRCHHQLHRASAKPATPRAPIFPGTVF